MYLFICEVYLLPPQKMCICNLWIQIRPGLSDQRCAFNDKVLKQQQQKGFNFMYMMKATFLRAGSCGGIASTQRCQDPADHLCRKI